MPRAREGRPAWWPAPYRRRRRPPPEEKRVEKIRSCRSRARRAARGHRPIRYPDREPSCRLLGKLEIGGEPREDEDVAPLGRAVSDPLRGQPVLESGARGRGRIGDGEVVEEPLHRDRNGVGTLVDELVQEGISVVRLRGHVAYEVGAPPERARRDPVRVVLPPRYVGRIEDLLAHVVRVPLG